jgi:hypothetical protein
MFEEWQNIAFTYQRDLSEKLNAFFLLSMQLYPSIMMCVVVWSFVEHDVTL